MNIFINFRKVMDMRKKISLSLGVVLASLCLNVNAGVAYGKIKYVKFLIPENILIVVPEYHDSKPACVNWQHSMGIKYGTSEQAKAVLTMVLSAQASGKNVTIYGNGTCFDAQHGFEVMNEMEISHN
jgi:hypothetical protein